MVWVVQDSLGMSLWKMDRLVGEEWRWRNEEGKKEWWPSDQWILRPSGVSWIPSWGTGLMLRGMSEVRWSF